MLRLWISSGLLIAVVATNAVSQTWRDIRDQYRRECRIDEADIVAELHATPESAAALPFPSLTSPEAAVYALGLAVIREDLDLYDAVRHPSFIFYAPHKKSRLDFAEDRERMRRIFVDADFTAVSLSVGRAEPSSGCRFSGEEGYVRLFARWHRVVVGGYAGIREERSLFVLLPEDLPDAAPFWRIVYWESPTPRR